MGWLKSVAHAIKRAVKAPISAVKNATKLAYQTITDPVGATKDLKNVSKTLAKITGLDVLMGVNLDATGTVPDQLERGGTWSDGETEGNSAQTRSRHLARQGMQGSVPSMLLGQDVVNTSLSTDEELAGKGAE